MKLLIIGGTYFLGRVFTIFSSKDHELTLVNRGRYTFNDPKIKEIHFNRHDSLAWTKVHGKYDAIIDFCAYDEGDIELVVNHIEASFQKYIFISTLDVYERNTNTVKNESTPLETRRFGGETGAYIYGKIQLEHELKTLAKRNGFDYVSLRLGNLYGPFNYTRRETELLQRVIQGKPLYHFNDGQAKFQLVYVKDVANAILLVAKQPTKLHAYNILDEELLDYDDLNFVFSTLAPCNIVSMNIDQALEEEYPLVYPIYKQEQELYTNQAFCKEFNFNYTPLEKGMAITYQAILPLFENQS